MDSVSAAPFARALARVDTRAVRLALWLVLIAQAIALWWLFRPGLTADSDVYLKLSAQLIKGRYGEMLAGGFAPDILRPPGLPLILALLHDGIGLSVGAIIALQLALVLLALYGLWRWLPDPARLPFLLLAAAYPFLFAYNAFLMTEPWVLAGLAAAFLLLTREGAGRVAGAGLLLGACALIRSDLLLLPLFIVPVLLAQAVARGRSLRRGIGHAALLLVTFALPLLPYAAWNEAQHGSARPVPLAGAVGPSLYLSTWQDRVTRPDIDRLYDQVATPTAERSGLAREVRALNRAIGTPPLTAPWNPATYPDNESRRAIATSTLDLALTRIAADPVFYAGHVARNVYRLWASSSLPSAVPTPIALALQAASFMILALGAAGALWLLWHWREQADRLPLLAFLFYLPAVHIWLHTEARYTAPVRPLLVALAALLIVELVRIIDTRRVA